jgi:hypothetical protein
MAMLKKAIRNAIAVANTTRALKEVPILAMPILVVL